MWVNGKWYEECEISAYVRKLEKERDAYKEELKDFLRKACECIEGSDADCSICPYYTMVTNNGCPSKVDVYAAKLRLEDLK